MELQIFIETTIKEITTGLHNSSKTMIDDKVGKGISDLKEINVDFDIAVSASSTNENEIGGKITVLGIGFNISGNTVEKNNDHNISRIKFTVPIRLKTLDEKPQIPAVW